MQEQYEDSEVNIYRQPLVTVQGELTGSTDSGPMAHCAVKQALEPVLGEVTELGLNDS